MAEELGGLDEPVAVGQDLGEAVDDAVPERRIADRLLQGGAEVVDGGGGFGEERGAAELVEDGGCLLYPS
ncbi:hypothetical protein, partial [Streptomyces venezuelae]|uniref:hypothetical protein n=1 Tax=Streptomyces venezuelae TaxID=54571 RepID=UPI0027E435AF